MFEYLLCANINLHIYIVHEFSVNYDLFYKGVISKLKIP
jgi:hypothetical protein